MPKDIQGAAIRRMQMRGESQQVPRPKVGKPENIGFGKKSETPRPAEMENVGFGSKRFTERPMRGMKVPGNSKSKFMKAARRRMGG